MPDYNIQSNFKEFTLSSMSPKNESVVIPTIKGTFYLKYGKHAYYFLNFKTLKGLRVTISHIDIIKFGLQNFKKAYYKKYKFLSYLRLFFQKFHYGFTFLEQIMLISVPHTVTHIGSGQFIINLWSFFGYLLVDCRNKTVTFKIPDNIAENHVLGSQQWFDSSTKDLIFMSYSLKDSLMRSLNKTHKVFLKILKKEYKTGKTLELWHGEFSDYPHDILINSDRQFCVIPELGMYTNKDKNLIPSKVLILDLLNNKHWIFSRFQVAAHAQFDPDDPNIIYFSNHNFEFVHTNILKLLKNAIYGLNLKGPASIYKYQLTSEGPKEVSVFTEPDFYRLTNFHVFNHRGTKIIAAMGSPNFIYIIDALSMQFIKKLEITHPASIKHVRCGVGTFSPSLDGEKLYIHTNRSFQIIDIASEKPDMIHSHRFNHSCSNHMITTADTGW